MFSPRISWGPPGQQGREAEDLQPAGSRMGAAIGMVEKEGERRRTRMNVNGGERAKRGRKRRAEKRAVRPGMSRTGLIGSFSHLHAMHTTHHTDTHVHAFAHAPRIHIDTTDAHTHAFQRLP